MKIWIYVEGPSDCSALNALWTRWKENLKKDGWGIKVLPLDNKTKFFRKIGAHAVEKLRADSRDLVVGLPDYYPNQEYVNTAYRHDTLIELLDVQKKLVNNVLEQKRLDKNYMERFHPSALKHDLEMLLLSAHKQLCDHLGENHQPDNWIRPVEEQNQNKPPKRIVEEFYRTDKGRRYRDTTDAKAVLSRVNNIREMLYFNTTQLNCPVFKNMLDWVGEKTGVPAY